MHVGIIGHGGEEETLVAEEALSVFQDGVNGLRSWDCVFCGETGEEARVRQEFF